MAFPVAFNWECSCRLKEYELEGETIHHQVLKTGQWYVCVFLKLRLCFLGGY